MTTPVVAVTMGDPAGVGPEICLLAVADPALAGRVRPVVIGDLERLERARDALAARGRIAPGQPALHVTGDLAGAAHVAGSVDLLDLRNVPATLSWGRVSAPAGRASFEYVERAVALARVGAVHAICTAPINKESWNKAGIPFPGHTEALAQLAGAPRCAMMLVNDGLRVVHVTTHVALRRALELLSAERVFETILLAAEALTRYVAATPRIAVAGLNPHAGEGGLFGDEEATLLRPAVDRARARGLDVVGPLSPDTVFSRAAAGEFDAVVALYHDQGHIPIKMLGLDTGVNVTIGLPFVRTSVDHGTAFDIAGQGLVRGTNMAAALSAAADFLAIGASAPRPG